MRMVCNLLVCGPNGAGKSTLGRALAEELSLPLRDSEDYWFPKDGAYLYERPRTDEEVNALLLRDLAALEGMIYAAVRCRAEAAVAQFDCAVYVEVPKAVRMARVRQRSYGKFGARMLPGGDLCEKEEGFFAQCEELPQNAVWEWLQTTGLPILRVDGTRPIGELVAEIKSMLTERNLL